MSNLMTKICISDDMCVGAVFGYSAIQYCTIGTNHKDCLDRLFDADAEYVENIIYAGYFCDQMHDYLSGKLVIFNYPINFKAKSEFANKVLEYLQGIPYGTTITYQHLAKAAGNSKAARAAANIVAKNNALIVAPCHRVVGKNSLGGFSGCGGVEMKRRLLTLEGCNRYLK